MQISQFFLESDSHAAASARSKREFVDTDHTQLSCIQTQVLALLNAHTKEMKEKYEKRDGVCSTWVRQMPIYRKKAVPYGERKIV